MVVNKPLPTLADIAAEAGVSLATASRVLSGSRDRVSAPLVERVQAAAQTLHYVPNAHAQALARASSTTIGLIVHDVSDPYFAEIARGVLRAASARDHLVLICNTFRDPDRELEYVGALRAQRVHSILLAGSGYTDPTAEGRLADELAAFRATDGRVASVGRHEFGIGIDAVLPDNVRGAARAADHLIELGHERIGVIAGPASLTTIEDRISGFRARLEEAGMTLDDDLVRHGDFTRAGGYEVALDLIDADAGVTAVFALNDAMAVGVLAAYRERAMSVPGDVSLIGFDDIPLAADVTPALTTIRLPMEDLGARAVELALREDTTDSPALVTSGSELVVRASTHSPRAH
jgi:LacI family transcriptional regulator